MDQDTLVLAPPESEEPPPPLRPNRETGIALGIAVVLVLVSVSSLGRHSATSGSEEGDRAARSRALAPGDFGRLLFTFDELPTRGVTHAERVYVATLGSSAVQAGPVIPAVSTRDGYPRHAPAYPPDRRFALGPEGSARANRLAFVADGVGPLDRVVYLLDVGDRRLPASAVAIGDALDYAWDGSGDLLLAREDGAAALDVVRVSPDGRRHPFAHVPRSLGEQPDLVAAAGRVYLAYTSRVLRVLPSGSVRTVLSGWQVLGESERGMLALLPSRPSGEIGQPLRLHWWFPSWEREPAPVPSAFEAFQVLGWSSDSSAVAALGELDGRPGLWVVPLDRNATPQMVLEGDPEAGFSVGPVAFAADDRFAFFATEDGLFGFDRSLGKLSKLQLPPDLERRVPNGPMVWVP